MRSTISTSEKRKKQHPKLKRRLSIPVKRIIKLQGGVWRAGPAYWALDDPVIKTIIPIGFTVIQDQRSIRWDGTAWYSQSGEESWTWDDFVKTILKKDDQRGQEKGNTLRSSAYSIPQIFNAPTDLLPTTSPDMDTIIVKIPPNESNIVAVRRSTRLAEKKYNGGGQRRGN